MSRAASFTRTGLMACILALVGFSYALATSNSGCDNGDSRVGGDVTERAAGSFIKPGANIALDFANPFVTAVGGTTERDIGDFVAGSAITRLIRAKGGVAPYKFTTATGSALPGTLALLSNGLLSGTPVAPTGAAAAGSTPFRFNITVTDALGTGSTKTNVFRLSYFVTNVFRFAVDKLSDGVQFNSYSDIVSTINGAPSISYAASTVTLNGAAQTSLASVGLGLATDGTLYGSPTTGGTLKFTCTATDKNGAKAAGRAGTGSSQVITINLIGSKSLSSLVAATQITIKQGVAGKDSLVYKGTANLQGFTSVAQLKGNFSIHIGNFGSPLIALTAGVAKVKGPPSAAVKVSNAGQVGAALGKSTIDVGAGTGATVTLPVEVRIGESIIGSETLTFTVKSGKGTAKTLTYKASNANDDGTFLLTSVQGTDDKAATGDAWKVGFIGRPGKITLDKASINFSIGTGFAEKQTLVTKGNKVSAKGAKTDGIKTFSADLDKGKGSLTTNLLTTAKTGISTAGKAAGKPANFAINMTFGATGFSFDGSVAVNAVKSKWSSKLTK